VRAKQSLKQKPLSAIAVIDAGKQDTANDDGMFIARERFQGRHKASTFVFKILIWRSPIPSLGSARTHAISLAQHKDNGSVQHAGLDERIIHVPNVILLSSAIDAT
jgi:hypothetical protein